MLTPDQKMEFKLSLASLNMSGAKEVDPDWVIDDDSQIVETRETIEHFFGANGRKLVKDRATQMMVRPEKPLELEKTAYKDVYKWSDVQKAKGKRRGDLFVVDFGDVRAAYFDGEE